MQRSGLILIRQKQEGAGHRFSRAQIQILSSVIPSEEDRSLVNGLRGRGICFFVSKPSRVRHS